jgi:hypothetical protein
VVTVSEKKTADGNELDDAMDADVTIIAIHTAVCMDVHSYVRDYRIVHVGVVECMYDDVLHTGDF